MRTASGALVAFLNANNDFMMADLYTFTMLDETVLRWTSFDVDIVVGGNTFSASGPILKRGRTRVTASLEVDTLDISIYADSTITLGGIPIVTAAMNGAFDGARVKLERIVMPELGDVSLGGIVLFEGSVAGVKPSSTVIELNVKSELERLNINVPFNLYMPACSHALYDAGCGVDKSAHTVTSAVVASPTPTTTSFKSGRSDADGYFDLGVVAFTSGANTGVRRAVKSYVSGVFTLALPLPHAPTAGDTISVYPGCKKDLDTCKTKFSNSNRFRGFPYVPRPEQAL